MADKSQVEYILADIRSITENMIIKRNDEAAKYETADTKREGDRYVAAMMERDVFTSYREYPIDVLVNAGITNVNDIMAYNEDKYKIPHKKRNDVLKAMRKAVIDEFEERNDYYRELIGKPSILVPEEEYIYLTEAQMKYYDIDEVRPIHDYPKEIQMKLERVVIPELIELYPERTYLQHMGSKAVNLVRAREAKNFEIIFTDVQLDNIFMKSFFETYDFCREYFMSVIYNNGLKNMYNLYDNFIGMQILIMTIQRMIADTIKMAIDRDFYDLHSIKKMFEAYGVPFFEDLPMDYQRTILKNLNILIRTKSTDRVLYDITNVLFYERVQIYKYYLVKERIMDENNKPVIYYKTVTDDNGEEHQVYDYERMYEFYFQSTDILEPNVILSIENKANKYHYNEVTDEDVFWWETEELKKELWEREYNFIDTKYLGVNLMQNLTNLLYETCYFLNLLVDNKDTTTPIETRILNTDAMKTGTDYLFITLERFSPIPISIFDTVVTLCALISKKNGMKGNIITSTPSKILSVLGFNFEANFDLIRANIQKYKRVFKDQSIVKYLDLLDIKTVGDIDTLYNNFRNFAEFCEYQLAHTVDIKEYKAYKQLLKVFTVREETGEAFRLSNGDIAKTYMEYLYDKVPHIAEIINELHKDKLGVYIEHCLGKLNELIPELEYLSYLNGTNNNIVKALISLVNFFKSYTTDLRNLNVLYMFDNKRLNKIYMIDDPRLFIKLYPEEKALKYHDGMHICNLFNRRDKLHIFSGGSIFNRLLNKDYVDYDESYMLSNKMEYLDDMYLLYNDTMHFINNMKTDDKLEILEQNFILSSTHKSDKVDYGEDYTIVDSILNEDTLELIYNDNINWFNQLLENSEIVTDDNLWATLKMEFNNKYEIIDKGQINNLFSVIDHQNPYDDTISLITESQFNNSFNMRDIVIIIHEE